MNLTNDEKKDPAVIIKKLEEFSKGTINETMERHTFNSRIQEDDEPFDDFHVIKAPSRLCLAIRYVKHLAE